MFVKPGFTFFSDDGSCVCGSSVPTASTPQRRPPFEWGCRLVSRQWGHIRTGQSATVDDDHFLISGDIQVNQINCDCHWSSSHFLATRSAHFKKNQPWHVFGLWATDLQRKDHKSWYYQDSISATWWKQVKPRFTTTSRATESIKNFEKIKKNHLNLSKIQTKFQNIHHQSRGVPMYEESPCMRGPHVWGVPRYKGSLGTRGP